jgi:predicted aspartyl protease
MGITYVRARLRRPEGRGPTRSVRFLVDSGAIYSVLPEETWRALRLKPEREVEFTLADGTAIKRGVSECRFEIRGEAATSPVVLGEENDGALLGAVTLETLGFMLNPLTREILPMRMALSHLRSSTQVEGCPSNRPICRQRLSLSAVIRSHCSIPPPRQLNACYARKFCRSRVATLWE